MLLQSFFTDIKSLTNISCLNSGIYAALTAAFVLTGLSYIGLPTQTLDLVFGTSAQKGLEDIFLWHLIGTAVSMGVAAIAFTQKVCRSSVLRIGLTFACTCEFAVHTVDVTSDVAADANWASAAVGARERFMNASALTCIQNTKVSRYRTTA